LTVGAGGTFIFKSAVAGSPVASAGGAVAAVPEPGTLVLLAAALIAGFGMWRRRK
jgi:hypothetical protein